MRRERTQLKRKKALDVECARLILPVIAQVFTLIVLGVHNAVLHQELSPQIVAVAREQGVVQIKDGETQNTSSFSCGHATRYGCRAQAPPEKCAEPFC